MTPRIQYIILILLLLAAVYLRLNGLSNLGLGFDETIHIYAALGILEHGHPIMPSGFQYDRALPFTYSVALSFKLFGVNQLSARIPSVLCGVLVIVVVFFLARDFFGSSPALVAAALTTYLPLQIVQSRSCRMYSMHQFFFLLSVFVFYKAIEGEPTYTYQSQVPAWKLRLFQCNINFKLLALAICLLYLSFRIHLLTTLFYPSILIYLFIGYIASVMVHPPIAYSRRKYLSLSLVWLSVGIFALLLPGNAEAIRNHLQSVPTWATYLHPHPGYYFAFLQSQTIFPIFIFFVLGAIQMCATFDKRGYYILTCSIVPLSFHSFIGNVQKPRYIYYIFPLILIIASFSISTFVRAVIAQLSLGISRKITTQLRRRLCYFAVVSVCSCTFVLPFYYGVKVAVQINDFAGYSLGGQYNAEWRQACHYLGKHREPGDVVIATIPLAAEFSGCGRIHYNLDNGEIDNFVKIEGERWLRHIFARAKCIIDLKDLQEVMANNTRGWLILDALRFNSPAHVRKEVRQFIRSNLNYHPLGDTRTIYLYSWDTS